MDPDGFYLITCAEPQVAENGVGISQLHQILLHRLALLRPCTSQLQLTARLMRMRIICQTRGSQRDVVYLGWPIAPSYMSPKAGGGGSRGVSANEYSCANGAQLNFRDLTPYLTYVPNKRAEKRTIRQSEPSQRILSPKFVNDFFSSQTYAKSCTNKG